ncbi:hypothetical protein B0H12DRAFT_1240442 [Mycena haematopus]|nr:hypothetical protein B0H12DRAFT_1240442 [Mycena haematopus]
MDVDSSSVAVLDESKTSAKRKRPKAPDYQNKPNKSNKTSKVSNEEENDKGGHDRERETLNAGDSLDEGPATVRYIDFSAHPTLAAVRDLRLGPHHRREHATFILRHEYSLLIRYAMSKTSNPEYKARFFVTGQTGIGKSSGCCYFLFRLLALGQSIFYLPSHSAIEDSWVLIDIDEDGWSCHKIFDLEQCII